MKRGYQRFKDFHLNWIMFALKFINLNFFKLLILQNLKLKRDLQNYKDFELTIKPFGFEINKFAFFINV